MKKHLLSLTVALTLFASPLLAQDWVKRMADPKANFYDVQKAFNDWYAKQKSNPNAKELDEDANPNYALFKRWEWYMQPRVGPTGVMPSTNLTYNNYRQYKSTQSTQRVASSNSWAYVGNQYVPNGGGAGRVNRLTFYPGNTNIIYACTPFGGLWKTTNGGTSWSTNTDQLASIAVSDLAINPLNPNVMYLCTGDGDGWDQASIGILKSYDGGNTWDTTGLYYTIQTSGPSYIIGTRALINPTDTAQILTGTTGGLYISDNGGITWKMTLSADIKSIEYEPFHSSTVYVGTYDGRFFRSVDSGFTFVQDTAGFSSPGIGRVTVGVSPADSNVVYLLSENNSTSGFFGLYMSTDRGQTFTPRSLFSAGAPNLLGWADNGGDSTGQGWYTLSLAVSPTNIDTVLVGGVNIWRSADSGKNWKLTAQWTGTGAPYVHADIHEIAFAPGSGAAYYVGCDGGVFTKQSTYPGNWTDISSNLEIGQQYSIGLSQQTPGLYLTGWQDNGTNASGSPWSQVIGGDGMVCFIDYTNDANMFGAYQNGALEFSLDGGRSWNAATGGITESGPWTTRWMQDPQQSNFIYAGFKNIWESGTQGVNWAQISSWGSSTITAMDVSSMNDQYIYAAQSNEICMTSDGGATWKNITGILPVTLASISGIAIDPGDPKRVWVTLSGWFGSDKVYESYNGGIWKNLSAGLPNLPISCIVCQPGSPDGIYIGTDIGVYYHDTLTNAWMDYSNGLPNVQVDDLKIYEPGNKLYAATYGRGTWEIQTYYTVGLNEVSMDKDIRVYPNPASSKVQVKFNVPAGKYELTATNVLGQQVLADNLNISGEYIYTLDVSNYSKGMYFLTIATNGTKTVKKIMVY